MGIVRFAAVGNDVILIGDADRRLLPEIAAQQRRDAALLSITLAQARMVERCRMLAEQYANATTDDERRHIAAEIAIAKSAAGVTRPVSEGTRPLPVPGFAGLVLLAALTEQWTLIGVEPGMVHAGYDKDGAPLYRYVAPPVGATEVCRRRWLKHPRTSQTQLYVAAPCKVPSREQSGSMHRVGNVPSDLVPTSLRGIADLMKPGY